MFYGTSRVLLPTPCLPGGPAGTSPHSRAWVSLSPPKHFGRFPGAAGHPECPQKASSRTLEGSLGVCPSSLSFPKPCLHWFEVGGRPCPPRALAAPDPAPAVSTVCRPLRLPRHVLRRRHCGPKPLWGPELSLDGDCVPASCSVQPPDPAPPPPLEGHPRRTPPRPRPRGAPPLADPHARVLSPWQVLSPFSTTWIATTPPSVTWATVS